MVTLAGQHQTETLGLALVRPMEGYRVTGCQRAECGGVLSSLAGAGAGGAGGAGGPGAAREHHLQR